MHLSSAKSRLRHFATFYTDIMCEWKSQPISGYHNSINMFKDFERISIAVSKTLSINVEMKKANVFSITKSNTVKAYLQ